MINKKVAIIIIISTVVACTFVVFGAKMLSTSTRYCREVSAWGALDTSIYCEMNDYYEEHGKYPDSLEVLNLVFEDGASPNMLNRIQYQSNGTSCKYSYNRHAGKWDENIKTHVEITFSEGGYKTYTATTKK